MDLIATLTKAAKERQDLENIARERAKTGVGPGLQQFLKDHPELESVRWTQYTPYFNDGDTCKFGIHELYFRPSDEDEQAALDDSDYGDGYSSIYEARGRSYHADLSALESALSAAEPEMLSVFGDHVQVTVTADGVDVEEYEHE